jgi:hypothetical protein
MRRRQPRPDGGTVSLSALLLTGGVVGSLVLAASQFMTLFHTRIAATTVPVASATVGSEHAYAVLPVAVLAALLAFGVWSAGSRPALLAVGALGLIALLISLARDLPDAHKQGLRMVGGHYVLAVNRPAVGLYAESLGAMILLITCVCGFILLGAPERQLAHAGAAPSKP